MARNEPSAALMHAVVLAYGPASATGAAVRHARTIVGESGTVEVVAATRAGRESLSRLPDGAVAIEAWGLSALRAVAERHASDLLVLFHDDVTVSHRGVDALVEAAARHRRPAVPWTNDASVDAHLPSRRPKHPGELDQLAGSVSERITTKHITFSCIVATGTQLAAPIDRLIHIPGVRLSGIPAVAARAVAHHAGRCMDQLPSPEGPEGRPLLVANLIVKDEAGNIEECIASLDGLVDRVEVVDTGSTDDTVSLARAAGAHVTEVPWRDDFGWARNQVLDQSRDAWFALWIDADERLTATNPESFRRILAAIAGDIEGLTIQIHNRNSDETITSSFYATRIFSTDGTTFAGALHERVLSRDGTDLHAVEASSVKLDHYGYADDVVEAKEKYLRNLDIAKRDHERDPSPRHAFEYARALGLGEGEPQLRVQLLSEAVRGDLDTAGKANVYAALAHAQIEAGDYEAAATSASEALDLVPDDDLAGAALARAATEIGDYETVAGIALRRQGDGPRPLFEIKANHVLIDSLVAAALIRLGRAPEALGRIEPHLSAPATIAWTAITKAALATDDPLEALTAFARADLSGLLVVAAAETLAPADTARLALARAEVGSPSQRTVAVGLLAATVTGDRRLIEALLGARSALSPETATTIAGRMRARGLPDLAAVLDHATKPPSDIDHDRTIARIVPAAASVLDLRVDPTPPHGQRFDVVVLGPLTDPSSAHAARAWLDPAGIVIAWDPPTAPTSLLHIGGSAPAPVTPDSTLAADLTAAGFLPEAVDGLAVARPQLDEDLLAVVLANQEADRAAEDHEIGIVTIGEAPEESLLWVRASIPGRIRLLHLGSAPSIEQLTDVETRAVDRVLVIPAGVVTEPTWVGALLAAESPADVGLLDSAGTVRHAGATVDGAPFAVGSRATDHPLLANDRLDMPLLAPFICDAAALSPSPTGRHLGGRFARSIDATVTIGPSGDLAGIFADRPVVALAGAPSDMSNDLRDAFDVIVDDRHRQSPIVVCTAPLDQTELASLRARGLFVLGGSTAGLIGVAAASRPPVVYYLGTAAFDSLFGAVVCAAPAAAHVAIDYHGGQGDLADALLPAGLDIDDLAAITAPTTPTPSIAEIPPPPERLAGTVSVIIPVWNNWELTEACLASLHEHAEAPMEIIVVDNGSSDATAVELNGRHDITVVTNPENLGFPTAVNQGLAAARGEFVCILNNDTIVTAGWLTEMLKALEIPGTGMVGPRSNQISGLQTVPDAPALSDQASAQRWARRFVRGREGSHWLINRLVGFCLLARRTLFEEVGGFDQGFGIGNYEDDELSARVLATGRQLRVADASVVLHHGGATFSKLGLDYGALMSKAGRHFGGRKAQPSGLLTALILSDGAHAQASTTARSLLSIADRIRVVERSGFAITEFESGMLRTMGIELLNRDWQDPEGAASCLEGIEDRFVLICEAGESIDAADWAKARVAIEAAPAGPIEIRGPSGFEVRIDRPEPAAIERFGSSSDNRITEIQIRGSR